MWCRSLNLSRRQSWRNNPRLRLPRRYPATPPPATITPACWRTPAPQTGLHDFPRHDGKGMYYLFGFWSTILSFILITRSSHFLPVSKTCIFHQFQNIKKYVKISQSKIKLMKKNKNNKTYYIVLELLTLHIRYLYVCAINVHISLIFLFLKFE